MSWLAGLAVVAAAVAAGGGAEEPRPLSGEPLARATGLRLLVANSPPYVLDVDSGKVAPVRGLDPEGLALVSVVGVGGRAGIVVGDPSGDARIWALRGRPARLSDLGTARDVTPAADGRAIWVKAGAGRGCVLRRVWLDGRPTGARTRIPCGWLIEAGGSLGVVARRTTVMDPATGGTIYRTRWGIVAVAGRTPVLAGPGKSFTLVDVRTGSERRLDWPSILSYRAETVADPSGRFVALGFADPAWPDASGNTIGQAFDAWLLDTRTAGLSQIPGLPALLGLKSTSMEWTDDGRLVLLGEDERGDFVAVWRPGRRKLSLKRLELPERAGSDSFAPLG